MHLRARIFLGLALSAVLGIALPARANVPDGSVTTAKIQDGAVTDAKILGVSASKVSGTVGNADTVDGKHATEFAPTVHAHAVGDVTDLQAALDDKAAVSHDHDAEYQKKYANVIVVAKSGGDFTDPVAAASSIVDASATNLYLIKIMPGIYDIGAQTVELPSFVDIEGSGEGTTKITGSSTNPQSSSILMQGSEVRRLTLEITGSAPGIWVRGGSAKFTDFTVRTLCSYAGVWSLDAALSMRRVTFFMDACGGTTYGLVIENHAGDPPADIDTVSMRMINASGNCKGIQAVYGAANAVFRNGTVDISGVYGTGIHAILMTIRNSDIRSTGYGVEAHGTTIVGSKISGALNSLMTDGGTKVSFSELVGSINPGYGTGMTCFNVHDENYAAVVCP